MRQTKSSIMGALVGLTLFATNAQAETVPLPEVEWDTNLSFFQFDSDKFLGQRLSVSCPAGSVAGSDGAVHGSDVYSSKSPICVAAVHAGRITEAGGVVTVQLEPGQDAYQGSFRNGVETADLPGTQRSMIFVSKDTASAADESRSSHISNIKWDTKFTRTGLAHRHLIGQTFTFNCPAAPGNMRSRRVVGTDVYAFDSMICRAAVHAGQINTDGGQVTLRMEPGSIKLTGSIRNGIETSDGSSGIRSLAFVDGAVAN